MKIRLQKALANAGIASRRKAEEYIKQGRVSVDGLVVTEMGFLVDPDRQQLEFDRQPIRADEDKIYILLNKPKGYVTTLHDPQHRPIVTSLVKDIKARLFPVGRLDLDTEGALLLTNDGSLAHRILHPSHEIAKTYIAQVSGLPSPAKLRLLETGIEVEGRLTAPAQVRLLRGKGLTATVEITIHEGRKRQVRLMFAAIGHPVQALKRTAYGKLELGDLPLGKYRRLRKNDLEKIFS